ncbi:hypothetical protein CVT25_000627 [Psilocybe cyanescens]|uniref:Uncharacterized protein n=1 Tax=Psilocybe cyanescens TaxID=93625 RepID=A0A409XQC4_PSICY|nr:hypothetical protein CVT25_000627 [Psilocybe cyanescens]
MSLAPLDLVHLNSWSRCLFPGHLAREDIRYSEAVSDIIQRFIRDVGLPTIAQYERCAAPHWKLPEGDHIPSAWAQQGVQPNASPPGSSVFTYHGHRNSQVVVIDSDDDDSVIPSQHQRINHLAKEAFLKDELQTVRQSLQKVEQALAASHCRENELLAKIDRLANTSAIHSQSTTHLVSHSTPCMPDHSRLTPGHRVKSRQAPSSPSVSISAAATTDPLRHNGRLLSSVPPCGRDNVSQMPDVHFSHTELDLHSPYGKFIANNGLEGKFFVIELIRTNIQMFLWRDQLLKAGIMQDILNELMSLMSSDFSDRS